MSLTSRLVGGALLCAALAALLTMTGGGHLARGGVLLLLALIVLAAFLAGRSLTSPLRHMAAAARAVAAGDSPRYPQSHIPEITALIRALRQSDRERAERLDALTAAGQSSVVIVEAMNEGIIATDSRGQVVLANRAARALLGYPSEGPLPDIRTLFRYKEARTLIDQALAGGGEGECEFTLDARTIVFRSQPLGASGVLVVLRDNTTMQRLETMRRDFVANVSHELKTPLTSIAGYAETLAHDDPDEATRATFLDTIRNNTRRMQGLIDDLLDLARIESGGWQPRPEVLQLDECAASMWSSVRHRDASSPPSFTCTIKEGAHRVTTDPNALRQILTNLFDNAARHVGPQGRVELHAERKGEMIEVRVSDNGSGIPAEHLGRIFERFYRVDSARSRADGGTGLGLAIVRHLVEAHGGRIVAESVPGAGTTLRFTLPAA